MACLPRVCRSWVRALVMCKPKAFKMCICCNYAKHTSLRRKGKDLLAQTLDNVSEWNDMSACKLLFQWASTIEIQLKRVGLVQSRNHHFIDFNLFLPWYSWKIASLASYNNHSLNINSVYSQWKEIYCQWIIYHWSYFLSIDFMELIIVSYTWYNFILDGRIS